MLVFGIISEALCILFSKTKHKRPQRFFQIFLQKTLEDPEILKLFQKGLKRLLQTPSKTNRQKFVESFFISKTGQRRASEFFQILTKDIRRSQDSFRLDKNKTPKGFSNSFKQITRSPKYLCKLFLKKKNTNIPGYSFKYFYKRYSTL